MEGYMIAPDGPKMDKVVRNHRLREDIERRFTYHRPSGNQAERYERIKAECKSLGLELIEMCPESRELSNALTSLDEVMFWSNAAIARRE